ncbi:arylsulfatase [Pseudomaricurvus alkylphenolicus]|uniref:arylsulfatase B n=1 Tax=Pseudomaricurvus alkylphenolicus TaxID=1306991 RepID=UPI00141FF282|nr:arylsulfatase [Pseudomaricurvus alkylphenolicus]NIB42307.1 arylsulfatase [Pseudomaricurvus alkylphenolicus]
MKLRSLIFSIVALSSSANIALASPGPEQPNILVIVADDLGWKDVGYNGSEIETPNLDRLANNGIRLDRFYSHPYCTATRASLMTGQTAIRMGIERPITALSDAHLPLDLKLLPEFLQEAGYQTALSGKWHLGHTKEAARPMARGFDQVYGALTGGIGYWDHVATGGYDWHRNEITLREEGYATRLIADEAVRVIQERDKEKPLFLYAAFTAPHLPNEAPQATIDKYASIDNEHRRVHAAMVDEMDEEIGRITEALEQEGIADNTIIWFLSDNGGSNEKYNRGSVDFARFVEKNFGNPAPTRFLELIRMVMLDGGSDNGPYRGGKGSTYEGGVLVPSVISWPAEFPSRPLSARVTVNDIMPTLLSVAGVEPKAEQAIDGADQSRLLRGEVISEPVDFLTDSGGTQAYYMDNWKLRSNKKGELELYNLERDPYESANVLDQEPDVVATMLDRLESFPRGEGINISRLWMLLQPESWGGEETREPWAPSSE